MTVGRDGIFKLAFTVGDDSGAMTIASLPSVLATAQTGMTRGVARLNHAASEIARGKIDVEPMVDLMTAEREVATNARVVRAADEMHKSLLDILA